MTDRATTLMQEVWNVKASTEEELVAAVLKLAVNYVTHYNAQNDMIVLDRNDLLELAREIYE
jgi:hypothetical protein